MFVMCRKTVVNSKIQRSTKLQQNNWLQCLFSLCMHHITTIIFFIVLWCIVCKLHNSNMTNSTVNKIDIKWPSVDSFIFFALC